MQGTRSTWGRRLLAANLILLLAAATLCRALELDHIPGLNGDEAWQGVQAQRVLRGEAISWRTPTGNPINPLTFLPLLALHACLPPSVALLRLIPLVSGVAALLVNYIFCRRLFGQQLAVISSVLLAVLPATVAYSRFAWDASQTVLISLPVLYCSLGMVRKPAHRRGWLIGAASALCLALVVHPTNLFLAPLFVTAAIWSWRQDISAWIVARRRWGVPAAMALFVVAGVAFCLAAKRSEMIGGALGRLVSPGQAAAYFGCIVDLLSGTTIYRFIPATQLKATDPATLAYRSAAWIILLASAVGVWRALQLRRHATLRILLAGLALGLLAFYLIAGPKASEPHVERYSMWMIAPLTLLLASGIQCWIRSTAKARLRPAVALLMAWCLLAGFGWYYIRPLRLGLTAPHLAFRTSQVEPKLAALHAIRAQSTSRPTRIVAQGWWLYWPLAYLAGSEPSVSVVPADVPGEAALQPENQAGKGWHVAFVESEPYLSIDGHVAKQPQSLPVIINDAAGRPLIRLVPFVTERAERRIVP